MIRVTFRELSLVLLAGLWPITAAAVSPPEVARPQIPDKTFTVTDFGAVGDGAANNTAAIVKAIDACRAAGGGVVVVPAGRFLTGPLEIFSKMNLKVDEGATLLFVDTPDAYP